ncbi:VIT and vWA domain-containing protein [Corallincola spongiicola]|nr:VIT and VWA domain-containing protein [Corallincola spongiicola]
MMKQSLKQLKRIISAAVLLLTGIAGATQAAGLMTPINSGQSELTLQDHKVKVTIADGFATTTVEQVFANPHAQDLEAIYSFPVPSRASVGEFTYWIDGAPVHGEVVEKQKARDIYEQEKQQGNHVALTEQESYQRFEIRVFPVKAQNSVKIRLVYLQPIEVDHGVGRFLYPLESGGVDEAQKAFWSTDPVVKGQFSFELELKSGFPVEALRFPKHAQFQLEQLGPQHWRAHYDSRAEIAEDGSASHFSLDEDILLYWRLQQGLPGAVELVSYKPDAKSQGTFMLTLTPSDDLQPLNSGRDWVLILDMSGSMSGKYQTLIEGVRRGFEKFGPEDRVRIVLFNNSSEDFSGGYVNATPANLDDLANRLAARSPGGGTNLMAGLKMGIKSLDADRTTGIWLVTDGVANVGETQQKKFLEVIKDKDLRLFTMILGNEANRPLLDALAKRSNGFALEVSNADDIMGQLTLAASKVNHQALHDIEVEVDGVKVGDLQPATIGSLYRGQQLQLFGHYWKGGDVKVTVKAKRGGQPISYRTQFKLPEQSTELPEIERLWAFAQIDELMAEQRDFGEDADRKDAVVDLAKQYGLVTEYTSMLVLEADRFAEHGIEQKNAQRIETEQKAREIRKSQPVVDRQVDKQNPQYNKPRSGFSGGGGSMGWSGLTLLLLVVVGRQFVGMRRRMAQGS